MNILFVFPGQLPVAGADGASAAGEREMPFGFGYS
jgi:hypothetical protein